MLSDELIDCAGCVRERAEVAKPVESRDAAGGIVEFKNPAERTDHRRLQILARPVRQFVPEHEERSVVFRKATASNVAPVEIGRRVHAVPCCGWRDSLILQQMGHQIGCHSNHIPWSTCANE